MYVRVRGSNEDISIPTTSCGTAGIAGPLSSLGVLGINTLRGDVQHCIVHCCLALSRFLPAYPVGGCNADVHIHCLAFLSSLHFKDLSEKYQSSVAASYRTKLEREARKFHKKLGGNLFESSTAGAAAAEADFFDAAADEAKTVTAPAMKLAPVAAPADPSSKLSSSLAGGKKKLLLKKKGGKKPKKGGLGAVKKSNTKANFDEIASRVNGEDEERAKVAPIEAASTEAITKRLEKFAVKTTSRDMSKMDEAKLAQAERLGMGRSRQTTNASVFSHSTSSAMQEVVQESDAKGNSVFADRDSRGGYLDREPRSTLDSDGYGGGNDDDFFKQSYGK